MLNEPTDIDRLLDLYAAGQASPHESNIVREYLMDDLGRFDILLEKLRAKAMAELGIDKADDFLPAHLRACSPSTFAAWQAFADVPRVSASMADCRDSTFKRLRDLLLRS